MERRFHSVSWVMSAVSAVLLCASELAVAATADNEVVIGSPAIIETFDPAQYLSAGTMKGLNILFNSVVSFESESPKIVPDLAESWKMSPDGKEIVFKLRRGVKFHDGTPFDAEAVKFNWDRYYKVNMASAGKFREYADPNGVEVVDEYTVRFRQTNPSPVVMAEFAQKKFGFNSPTYIKAHMTADDPLAVKWMNNHECGTGPFELVEWEPDAKYVFKKFAGYWGGAPGTAPMAKIDKLTYRIIKDPSAMRMMLERGDLDIAEKLPSDVVEQLSKSLGIKVRCADKYKNAFIIMNCQKPPFDNVRVRQAISYAVNYDELIEHVERGRAKRMAGTVMEGFPGYDPNLFKYNHNLEKAKQLMKEAGYPNGFSATLLYSLDRYAGFDMMSVMVQSYLKKIGINLTLQKMAWPVQMETMNKGNFDMSLQIFTAHYPESVEMTYYFFYAKSIGRWNWSYWKNDKATELCDVIMYDMDPKNRAEATRQVQKIGVDNAVYVYLYQIPHCVVMRENVENLWVHPGSMDLQPCAVSKRK